MSIKDDDDPLLKLHESLKEAKKDDTVSISSEGEVAAKSQAFMNAQSLKEALQTLVKYAKQLEEAGENPEEIPLKMLEKYKKDNDSD